MDGKTDENKFYGDADTNGFLEMVPAAAVIWSSPRIVCALNKAAQHLFGFSEADLADDNRFWSKRVYWGDRRIFAEREKKMECGISQITCEYRFHPKGLSEPIRVREVSFSLRHPDIRWKWMSMYNDISMPKRPSSLDHHGFIGQEMRESIGCLFHEIKNRLHLLSMELELAVLESEKSLNAKKLANALDGVNHSIKTLHDYLIPGRNELSSQD